MIGGAPGALARRGVLYLVEDPATRQGPACHLTPEACLDPRIGPGLVSN